MKIRWTLIAALALMTSCGKEIPKDIIQPEQMEDILYDYHLSQGMNQNGKSTEKEAHKNYIFRKHQVTEALFDSSMVWYTRESQELTAIYESLNRRFKREHDHFERLLDSREDNLSHTSISGDTVDIWRKGDIHWLADNPLSKQQVFEIKADTTFHERDAFLWDMDYHFFAEGKAVMGMNVVYENDSVIGETKLVETSGSQSISLQTDSAYKVKMLNGFIYVLEDSVQEPNILIHGMSLTRYHRPEPTDSLKTDEVQTEKPKVEAPKPKVQEEVKLKDTKELRKPRKARMMEMEKR